MSAHAAARPAPMATGRVAPFIDIEWKVAGFIAAAAAVLIAQLYLGAEPLTLALCATSIAIGFAPMLMYGRDLYTCLCAIFVLRYTGAAIIFKTTYGQPIETFLYEPVTTYILVTALMVVEVSVILIARQFDKGKSVFPTITNVGRMRQMALTSFVVGSIAGILFGNLEYVTTGTTQSGPLQIISSCLMSLTYLGLTAESVCCLARTRGRTFITARLSLMLAGLVVLSLFLNARGLALNAVLSVFVVAFMSRTITARHTALAVVLISIFTLYLSPISLELRTVKQAYQIENATASRFMSDAVDMTTRAILEPAFIEELRAKERFRQAFESGVQLYDYYGDNANIANRLSFVALLDAVYSFQLTAQVDKVGAMGQVWERVKPSFLSAKEQFDYGYGDWLTWQLGLIENGRSAFLSFSLPMEALAVFGIAGLFISPFVFMLPALLICGRLSSWRHFTVPSLFMFNSLHSSLVEVQSDGYIAMMTRTIPILVLPVFCMLWFYAQGSSKKSQVAS